MSAAKKRTRTLTGKVVSNKMEKSITVLVERRVRHPVYGKYMTKSSKVHAHDEKNECNVGDVVSLSESKPISKTKAWQLVSILESALVV